MPRPTSYGRWAKQLREEGEKRRGGKREEEMVEASIEVRLSRPDTRSSMGADHHVTGAAAILRDDIGAFT